MARTKIDRRIIKTKKAINNALLQLLSVKSLDEISITELTNRADVNRKTFYLHYASINEVAEEINNRLTNDFEVAIERALANGNGFDPAAMFGYFNERITNDNDFFRAFCAENTSGHFLRVLQPALLNRLLDVYTELYPAVPTADLADMLVFLIAGCFSLYFGWIHNPINTSVEALSAKATKLCNAVLSQLGE